MPGGGHCGWREWGSPQESSVPPEARLGVYELLGAAGEPGLSLEIARGYERAFEAYWNRDFAGAIQALEPQKDDAPSALLLRRCRRLRDQPPPADWDGTHVAETK